jgi:hypothetical protein
VGLERGPPSLMSIIEELLERNSRGSGLEIREYDRRDPLCSKAGSAGNRARNSASIVRNWTRPQRPNNILINNKLISQ